MKHSEVVAAFLTEQAALVDTPDLPLTDARRLRDVAEPVATIGWWSPEAGAGYDELGLDFLGGYVWGRAASLGAEVDTAVVSSAFGVFDDGLVDATLTAARSVAPHDRVLATREEGAAVALRRVAADLDDSGAEALADPLMSAIGGLDGSLRPLFSGLRSLPVPTDPFARLWRACELVREHRGDGHLAACVAAGLDRVEMNVLTELWLDFAVGEYSGTRGFTEDRLSVAVESLSARGWVADGALTEEGRGARESIEHATDVTQHELIRTLGDRLDELIDGLGTVADAVIAAPAAPTDPRKRAAG